MNKIVVGFTCGSGQVVTVFFKFMGIQGKTFVPGDYNIVVVIKTQDLLKEPVRRYLDSLLNPLRFLFSSLPSFTDWKALRIM